MTAQLPHPAAVARSAEGAASRGRRHRLQEATDRAQAVLVDVLILVLAAVAFRISFQALNQVVVRIGAVSEENGPYMAVLIDGFMVVVTLIARTRRHDGEQGWSVGYPFLLVGFAAAVSMLANAAHAADSWGARAMATLPPLLLFLAIELRSAELRRRRHRPLERPGVAPAAAAVATADPAVRDRPPAAGHSRGIALPGRESSERRRGPRGMPAPPAPVPSPHGPAAEWVRSRADQGPRGRSGGKQANRLRVRSMLRERGTDLDWSAVAAATGLGERRARELLQEERARLQQLGGERPHEPRPVVTGRSA